MNHLQKAGSRVDKKVAELVKRISSPDALPCWPLDALVAVRGLG
jgi:hypothetical protein